MARSKVKIAGSWVAAPTGGPRLIGSAPTPPTPPSGTPTAGLFFEAPDTSASTRKAFAHWFSPYPIRTANVAASGDTYAVQYLRATGNSGLDVAYGGLWRDRPLPQPVSGSGTWQQDDCGLDVDWAQEAGLDGFFMEILGSYGAASLTNNLAMRDKVEADYPGFLLVPQIDGNGNLALSGDVNAAADIINEFAGCGWFLGDGRMVVATFRMEGKPPSYWDAVTVAAQTRHGLSLAWVGVFNVTTNAGTYQQWASGRWGSGADPAVYAARSNYAATCASRGQLYLADVWSQDIRPNAGSAATDPGWFDEARGLRALAAAFDDAEAKAAPILCLNTWSDYSEGSYFRPSPLRGQVACDYSRYRISKWKTGHAPAVLADAVYLTHRTQMIPAGTPTGSRTILGPQTVVMAQNATRIARSTLQNKVEIMTALTAPATVEVTVNGVLASYSAPEGVSFGSVDAAPGAVSVEVKRSAVTVASVTSPVGIDATPYVDDAQYAMFGSIRGTTGQFNPQQTDAGATPTYP